MARIPRSKEDDYTDDMARARRDFVEAQTGVTMPHTGSYSFDAATTRGNIEHFTGVCQIPLGLAGPVRVNGEAAVGEFYVPMTTTEGTLGMSDQSRMSDREDIAGCTPGEMKAVSGASASAEARFRCHWTHLSCRQQL
ncbi:hypothetical protein KHP57_00005, partial [Algiphilus sp. NNCM1]|nr:hypothetical protein [Algiphilus acroporae]